jgi:excisionase family DNA binding protein
MDRKVHRDGANSCPSSSVHRTAVADAAGVGQFPTMTGSVPGDAPRFLQLADVAQILNISAAQAYALVRNGSLPAIKVGGRGQWRVEAAQLEAYIERAYDDTRRFVEAHPYGRGDEEPAAADLD